MLYKKELLTILGLFLLIACSSSLWDDMPEPIATFVSTYYPMSGISEYSEHNGVYYVTIKNGASMTFDSTYTWLEVNGNGVVLPQLFVQDALEPKLVQYLMELELTDQVYAAKNDPREVILDMLNYKIRYIKETGEISQIGGVTD